MEGMYALYQSAPEQQKRILDALLLTLTLKAEETDRLSSESDGVEKLTYEVEASRQDMRDIKKSLDQLQNDSQKITASLLRLEIVLGQTKEKLENENFAIQARETKLTEINTKLKQEKEALEIENHKLKEGAEKVCNKSFENSMTIENIMDNHVKNLYKSFKTSFPSVLSNCILSTSPTLTVIFYYNLYTFADSQNTFQLCDRLALLAKLKSLINSDLNSCIKPKLDALMESLPQSVFGIIGQKKMRISNQNNTLSVTVGSDCDDYRFNIEVDGITDVLPTWVFVPADDTYSMFRIRSNKADGMQLIADSLNFNALQGKLTLKKSMHVGNDGLWQLQDVDWRNDNYVLHNQFRAGNLNFENCKKRAYVSLDGQRDCFKVVKLTS